MQQLNLLIWVSELDIDDNNNVNQRDQYAEVFPAIWEHPAVVGVTIWGYRDGETWRADRGSDLLNGESPKPALQWLQQYFEARRSQ